MNAYAYWQAALKATPTHPGPTPVVDQPECGFYRLKRNKVWLPVAVFKVNGEMTFKIGGQIVGTNAGKELWAHYCAHPVTEDTYRDVAEHGKDWPDADPTVAQLIAQNKPIPVITKTEEKISDSLQPDSADEYREQIETALGGVPAYAKIESDEADVRALSLRNMLNDLAANADKAREAEKRPHFEAAKAVDAKWQPLIKEAREGAGKVKVARDEWANDKLKAKQQADQRAREAADEAMVAGKPPEPTPPSNLPPPVTQVRPTYGRASPTGTKMVVTEVDYDKFFAALKTRPEWPIVKAQFDEWAQKLANKGIIPDGVKAEEKANTR